MKKSSSLTDLDGVIHESDRSLLTNEHFTRSSLSHLLMAAADRSIPEDKENKQGCLCDLCA